MGRPHGSLGGHLPKPNLHPALGVLGMVAMAPTRVGSGDNPPRLAHGACRTSRGLCRGQRGPPSPWWLWGQHRPPQRQKRLCRLTLFILSTVVLRRNSVLTLMLWTLSLERSSASSGCFLGCWRRGKAQVSTDAAAGLAAEAAGAALRDSLSDCVPQAAGTAWRAGRTGRT